MSSNRHLDMLQAELDHELHLKRVREARIKERMQGYNKRAETIMAESKPKTGEIVTEALVFTYLGAGALALLINIVFFGAAQWGAILILAVGGAVVVGLFAYAFTAWVRAWRVSRSRRG